MMNGNTAIRVSGVNKTFKLPHEKHSSVKSAVINFYRRDKSFEIQKVLDDISFEVKKGEFFGIVGRNGSGKSTLLKILAGIYTPSQGGVEVAGRLVPFIELGVGFNPELTGRDNVFLNGALLGFSRSEMQSMYKDIVDFAELSKFMDQKLKNYSSGMQVRLAFSIAIRARSDILLVDEVLAVGDADFQRKCFDYFSRLRKDKKTVIFVSHDMDAVRKYCDRSLILDEGSILKIGDTQGIADKYLRLFTEQTNMDASEPAAAMRWGLEGWKTERVKIDVSENKVKIVQDIISMGGADHPVVGIRIRSGSGQAITGTNTAIEGLKLPPVNEGQKLTLTWEVPNIFSDGRYYIDPAILKADGITVEDWWDEASKFTIKKGRTLPYEIDPGIKVALASIKNV